MSTKLRDLIRSVRACKTAAEERALVQREKAAIRESFLANENEYRPRNVAKLLFVSMLGHDTDFGQMECLKLITANSFTEKRIGYLGLTQLFNEKSEVLMMATNRIRIDLNNQSNYIVSLALMALSEICTAEMCRDLASEVLKLLQQGTIDPTKQGTSYIKKKAALASTRIVKKVPEKLDDFVEKVELLMEDRHHGVLIATLQLCQHIIQIQPERKTRFVRFVAPMARILKSLVSTYSAEYDVSGINDPFLQIEILRFFRVMCEKSQQLSDEVSDILTQVTTNTTSNKNTGNAVLYEAVKTIMTIESANTLKTLGINILGKFLANKDANSKYVSLFMLQKVLKHDINAVQKYKSTIIDCLKENDTSIKTLALDLIYLITNESNVKSIVKELLNYLLNLTDDNEFIQELTNKICAIVNSHAPNRRWYIDTLIRVLILAGNFVLEESTSSLIHLISGTPELQSYAVHKLFFSLQENLNQEGLARITVYCLGDFGHILVQGGTTADNSPIQVSESEVIALIQKVIEKPNQSDTIKEYSLSALIKLYSKFSSGHALMQSLIKAQSQAGSIEVQKRAMEYLRLLEQEWDQDRKGICEQIPPSKAYKSIYQTKPIGDTDIDEFPPEAAKAGSEDQPSRPTAPTTTTPSTKLSEFEEIFGVGVQQTVPTSSSPTVDLIGSLLNLQLQPPVTQQPVPQQTTQIQQQPVQQLGDPFSLLNIYNQPTPQPIQQQFQPIQTQFQQPPLPQHPTQPVLQNFAYQQPTALSPSLQQPNLYPTYPTQYPATQQQPQFPVYNQPQEAFAAPPASNGLNIKVFDDGALEILFTAAKDTIPENTSITASFNNKSNSAISNIVFQVAVLKYLKMQMNPLNSSQIAPNSFNQVQQVIKITNSAQGTKAIVMKLKISYLIDGRQVSNDCTVNQFPVTF